MTKTLPSVAAAALLTLGITLGTTVSVTAGLAPTASAIDTTTIAPNLPYVTKVISGRALCTGTLISPLMGSDGSSLRGQWGQGKRHCWLRQ